MSPKLKFSRSLVLAKSPIRLRMALAFLIFCIIMAFVAMWYMPRYLYSQEDFKTEMANYVGFYLNIPTPSISYSDYRVQGWANLEIRDLRISVPSVSGLNTLVRGPRQVMKLHRVYYHPNCEFSTGSCKIGIRVKFSKESSVSINYRFHYRDWFNKTEPLDTSSLYEFSMLNLPLKYFLYVATSTRASDGFLSRFRGRMSGRGYVNFSRELKTRHKAAIYGLKLADLHFDLSQDGIRKKKRIKLRPVELNATITKNWQFKLSHNRSRKLKIRSNFGSILVAGSVDFSNDETSLRVRRLKSFGYSPWNSRYTPYVRLKISRSGKKSGLLIALKEFNRCKAHVGGQIYVSGLLSMTRCFGK